jgi:hypothetical protein
MRYITKNQSSNGSLFKENCGSIRVGLRAKMGIFVRL